VGSRIALRQVAFDLGSGLKPLGVCASLRAGPFSPWRVESWGMGARTRVPDAERATVSGKVDCAYYGNDGMSWALGAAGVAMLPCGWGVLWPKL